MKKIGITGGSGFIGQQVTSLLLEKKYKIKSCDLYKPKKIFLKNKNYQFKKIDLFNKKKLENFFNKKHFYQELKEAPCLVIFQKLFSLCFK